MSTSHDMLLPRARYYGSYGSQQPNHMLFNANLQEFAQRVSYICNLETAGKLSPEEAYEQVRELWHQLKQSKKELNIA